MLEANVAYTTNTGLLPLSNVFWPMWLQDIRKWQKTGICEALGLQRAYVLAFMNDTCSARTDTPWCLIDDSVHVLWYHTSDGRMRLVKAQLYFTTPNLSSKSFGK